MGGKYKEGGTQQEGIDMTFILAHQLVSYSNEEPIYRKRKEHIQYIRTG